MMRRNITKYLRVQCGSPDRAELNPAFATSCWGSGIEVAPHNLRFRCRVHAGFR